MSTATPRSPDPPNDHAVDGDLLHRVEHGVSWITLNRPHSGNALTPDQRNAIIEHLDDASGDLAVRAVVLTASGGKAFCTGADLRIDRPDRFPKPDGAPERPAGAVARTCVGAQRLIAAIQDCEKPVIAAVNGTAAGIGAHIAFASDLVLAADTARFIEVFVRRGIIPDGGGAYLLTRLVGPQKAKELIFFGDDLPAADAAAMGLVNRVVPAAALAGTAREWAERLATGPTPAIGLSKWLVNRAMESDRVTAFGDERMAQEVAMASADAAEGLASFAERRTAEFTGW
ncbi:MAG TPA: enoyl-CoA hydratase-related protein [Acidimicrobiia bacterium]|nr:enoyl-CoA hydratase-related protein [Acidimicrobiia bacterium]